MTTMPVQNERRAEAIATRVRGLMAEQRKRGVEIARLLHLSQPSFSRRSTGELAFSVDEIEMLAEILGVTEEYLYGFTNDRSPRPMDEGLSVVRHQGLEPRTRWLTTSPLSPVVRLIPAPNHPDDRPKPERPAAVISLAERRRTRNSPVRGSGAIAPVIQLFGGRVA